MDAHNVTVDADPLVADGLPRLTAYLPAWPTLLAALLAGYVVLCNRLRFRFEKQMRRQFNFPDRASLARMTNTEAQQIMEYIVTSEFPFTYKLSLQFGIFKTYGFATISKLLVATRALTDPDKASKRYEDTSIIFSEFTLNPPQSDRCLEAIARMNYLHSKYKAAGQISNADFLYTLGASLKEPTRFIRLYEWRPLNEMERCALGVFWKDIGDGMGIEYEGFLRRAGGTKGDGGGWRDGLDFGQDLTEWALQYERSDMRPSDVAIKPSRMLVEMLLHAVPAWATPFAVETLTVLMGERMRDAFHFPEPGVAASALAYGGLLVRRLVLRHLVLPRRAPLPKLSPPDPVTGRYHWTEYLVDPWYHKPTFWSRWGPGALVTRALGGRVPTATPKGCTGKGDGSFMPQGYSFQDIGPVPTMGKGKAEAARDVARLRQMRLSGCPFA